MPGGSLLSVGIGRWKNAKGLLTYFLVRRWDTNGNPIGIGLSNWRVNIGAGSFENRENKEVTSTWNRTECFLSPDGSYDFSKQAGQQWFMKAAKERGVDDFLFLPIRLLIL